MQQAIYTNTHIVKTLGKNPGIPGHGTGTGMFPETNEDQSQVQRFRKLRLAMSVVGNVLGGTILLSGMLMLPQLVVNLLVG